MRWLIALLAVCLAKLATAAPCTDQIFDGASYTICEVTTADDLRLFHSGPDGVLGSFSAVNDLLATQGQTLGFAMNAGMYHPDRAPVGLYIEQGRDVSGIITSDGPGNFGLLPNGVFCVTDRFAVIESHTFVDNPPACRFATQSGPMLVIDDQLHPDFAPQSDSLNIRNGVGVSPDGMRAIFAISNQPVNFHAFARFFRDALRLPNALFLDGSISRLYAPNLGRDDIGLPLGPIVGTVVPKG